MLNRIMQLVRPTSEVGEPVKALAGSGTYAQIKSMMYSMAEVNEPYRYPEFINSAFGRGCRR